jgi:hypothetical protein
MHKKPTREVSGLILGGGGGGAGALRNLITLLGPLPPITKLIRNEEETVRYIILYAPPVHKERYTLLLPN